MDTRKSEGESHQPATETDIGDTLDELVEAALNTFTKRAGRVEGLDELRGDIVTLARLHAARTVHDTVTLRRRVRSAPRRCAR